MIANDLEYRTTKAELRRFENSLARAGDREAERHPVVQRALLEAVESDIEVLRREIAEYEALRNGRRTEVPLSSFGDIADALIAARIAARWSQRDFARRLGLKHQQVQRYEATRYQSASFARILEIVKALRIELSGRARFDCGVPTPEPDAARPEELAEDSRAAPLSRRG